MVRIP